MTGTCGSDLKEISCSIFKSSCLIFIAVFGALATAWSMQLFFNMEPCELCLIERIPYYISLMVLFIIGLGYKLQWRSSILYSGIIIVALLLLSSGAVSAYHAGVEWKLWSGPSSCSGSNPLFNSSGTELLGKLKLTKIIRCDEPPFTLLGLSPAGWNVLFSASLALLAVKSRKLFYLK